MVQQRVEPGIIIQRWKIDPDGVADQRPELVARVRVIAPGGKRLLSRQAAEDEQARPLIDDWRKGAFAQALAHRHIQAGGILDGRPNGRSCCRERRGQYVELSGVAVSLKK